ncbi:hypothetical protein FHT76_000664 [Rhizobium sp. BK176]|nr:hypothetical protein [Rhizobium sp. BK176]
MSTVNIALAVMSILIPVLLVVNHYLDKANRIL